MSAARPRRRDADEGKDGILKSKIRLLTLLGALVAALALVWLVWPREQEAAVAPAADEPAAPVVAQAPPAPARPAARPARPEPAPYKEEVVTSDGLPIMPVHGEPTGPSHPHPITSQHQRLYAENRFVGGIEGAIDARDPAEIRRLLEKYRREFPEDDQEVQDGYAIVADCMDHPGASARGAALQWIDAHNGSTAKRYVLRTCLEPAAAP